MTPHQKFVATLIALRTANKPKPPPQSVSLTANELAEFILSPSSELGEHGLAHIFDGKKISKRLENFIVKHAASLESELYLEQRADGHAFLWQKKAWDSSYQQWNERKQALQAQQIANAEMRERIAALSTAFCKGKPRVIQENKSLVEKYITALLHGEAAGDSEAIAELRRLESLVTQ